ncbi:hypothetical protein [Aquimarina macrocephali]|uniref:hypothetical protein n=1 Tax=Aquimarina macrocephali TaxID=666563 RepID=UPI0004BCC29A|nr:hypothetical protein [Aquimarina macrocephali]
MKRMSKHILILFITFLLISCKKDDDGTLPITSPNPNKTTTYNNDVKTIIDDQCLRCHTIPLANGAPFALRNFKEVKIGVGRGFVERVTSNGNNVMPPAGRLPQATIDIILDWKADGFLEK